MYESLNPYLFIALSYGISLVCILGYGFYHHKKASMLETLISEETRHDP